MAARKKTEHKYVKAVAFDSLRAIAARYRLDYEKLVKLNPKLTGFISRGKLVRVE